MRIISWNINGINAHFEALCDLVTRYEPDIVCLQKVKSKSGIENFPLPGYDRFDIDTYRSQYYGVSTYLRQQEHTIMNFPNDLAAEGHLQAILLDRPELKNQPALLNVYAPYSGNNSFIQARKAWDAMLSYFVGSLVDYNVPVIMCGDFNVVHQAIDTWNPQTAKNCACYYDWEVENFNDMLRHCRLVDVFRALHPHNAKFTYFDSKGDYRATNQGNRIDYFLISEELLRYVSACDMIEDVTASNSNPIYLDIF